MDTVVEKEQCRGAEDGVEGSGVGWWGGNDGEGWEVWDAGGVECGAA